MVLRIGRIAIVLLALQNPSTAQQAFGQPYDLTLASGTLTHHVLTNDLFHVASLWMRVRPETEFHRWLSQGIDRQVTVILTTNADRFEDVENVRILRGPLICETAPDATRIVHIVFVRDELTGSPGPITFETGDSIVARAFDAYEDADVSIVIQIS